MELQPKVNQLFRNQLNDWELARKNYLGLEKSRKKVFELPYSVSVGVQFNPERIYSSSAKVDAQTISERKCFLCMQHLFPEQLWIEYETEYLILVNPFPIFQRHLTIPVRQHTDQLIKGRMRDMLNLARQLSDFEVFYNGPRCGASAPDHFHFQAGNKGFMPLASDFASRSKTIIRTMECCRALFFDHYARHCIILQGKNAEVLITWFEQLYASMHQIAGQKPEPMMNIVASWQNDHWLVFIFPRRLHRPWQFFEEGNKQILLSPASVDLGGMFITPREEDFEKLTVSDITDIFEQITWETQSFEQLISRFASQ